LLLASHATRVSLFSSRGLSTVTRQPAKSLEGPLRRTDGISAGAIGRNGPALRGTGNGLGHGDMISCASRTLAVWRSARLGGSKSTVLGTVNQTSFRYFGLVDNVHPARCGQFKHDAVLLMRNSARLTLEVPRLKAWKIIGSSAGQ